MMNDEGIPLSEWVDPEIDRSGPRGLGEFCYIDIGSIDRTSKRVVDAATLPVAKAPSRAKQVLEADDVLVSMTRPNLNAVAIVPSHLDGAIGSTGFHVLRAKHAEPRFLFYAVQTHKFIEAMSLKVQGALYPAVRPADISSFCIPPFSLARQRRIVAKIEELFSELEAGEESLRLARRQLATYRQSLLKQAFEGKLTVKWREQTKAAPATESTLGRLVEIKSGNGFPKHLQGLEDGDYPFFKVGDISKNAQAGRRKLDRANNYISKETTKQIRGTIIPPNATVFAKIGAAVALNRRGLTKEPCLIDNNAMALIPGDKLDPEFLFLFMRQVDLGEKTRGGAVPSLRKGDLEEISIALPALPEQQEIVRLLDEQFEVIERNEREIDAALRRSEALRQAILKKAFTGKLVPQDSADEPATELFARLRAEKARATTEASGKKPRNRRLASLPKK